MTVLVVFDIDGTLVDSVGLDHGVSARALSAWLGDGANLDVASYVDHTDSGIPHEAFVKVHGRAPRAEDLESFVGLYAPALLEALEMASPQRLRIAGAEHLPGWFAERPGFVPAIATGCFDWSARAKLAAADLSHLDWPLSTSDEIRDRVGILRRAVELARQSYGPAAGAEGIVYVGDGAWDVRATRELGWPLIGRGSGDQAARLLAGGAVAVLPDFADLDSWRLALQAALQT